MAKRTLKILLFYTDLTWDNFVFEKLMHHLTKPFKESSSEKTTCLTGNPDAKI